MPPKKKRKKRARPTPAAAGGAPVPAREGLWVFLGDSITIGTQGKAVVENYQKASYGYRACERVGIYRHVAAMTEPGLPQRIWANPKAGDPNLPDPNATPDRDPVLFVDLVGIPDPRGARKPVSGEDFANILAIDGTEIRQSITQGRESKGAQGTSIRDEAPGRFENDFVFEVVAGLEANKYHSVAESEYGLGQELLYKNSRRLNGRSLEPHDFSQLEQARGASPDAVVVWLGNNDTLQAILYGHTLQARLTPLMRFNRVLHKKELDELQPVREAGLAPSIPELFSDAQRDAALDKLGFLTFREALEQVVSRIRRVPREGNPADETKAPDVVLTTLPDDTRVPLLVPVAEGATLGDQLGPENRFPFRVVLFGVDITEDVLKIKLSARKLWYNEAREREELEDDSYKPGTRVCLLTIMSRFARVLSEASGDSDLEKFFADLFLGVVGLIKGPDGKRAAIRGRFPKIWKKLREDVLEIPLAFRRDEVLTPADQILIRERIAEYNSTIRRTAEREGFAVFDVDKMFKDAFGEGFVVKDAAGETFDTIKATWRGGIFSMDGGHPGNYGHAILASELLEAMRAFAAAKGMTHFGKVPVEALGRFPRELFQAAKDSDEVLNGARRNPVTPPV